MNRCLATCLLLLPLSACNSVGDTLEDMRLSSETNIGVCPNVFALDDAARVLEFEGEPALETVAWTAEITDVRTSCRYNEDRPIRAQVEIDMAVGRGPAAAAEEHEVTYFVAVTRRNRELIAKEEFTVPVRVRDGIGTIRFTEKVDDIFISRAGSDTSGTNFEIAVGFALTRDQVLFNRSGKSLRYPEL